MENQNKSIDYEQKDHVALITINRYERRNSIDVEHAVGLINAWRQVRDDPDVRVAIITGVKDAFCAGGDLAVMGQISKERAELGHSPTFDAMTDHGRGHSTLKGMEITKPIIAAVNGNCMAGGMELLGGTDIRIASSNAVFAIAEVRRGLVAYGGTISRLPRQLTWPAAMELLLMGANTSAERALQLGLVNKVVRPEELLSTAMEWAKIIAKNAPLAVQATKRAALRGFAAGSLEEAYRIEDEISAGVLASEDAQEGPRAFLEKREPIWKGR